MATTRPFPQSDDERSIVTRSHRQSFSAAPGDGDSEGVGRQRSWPCILAEILGFLGGTRTTVHI